MNLTEQEEQQMTQQNEFIAKVLKLHDHRRNIVQPDIFAKSSTSPNYWLSFYEYACEKIEWVSDDQMIQNMRRYFGGVAKEWYDMMQLLPEPPACWQNWKTIFCLFSIATLWNAGTLRFTYRCGSLIEYFLEKRRLLYDAEPELAQPVAIAFNMQVLYVDVGSNVR